MKSDAGSIMSRINSFTDTTGLRSPQSFWGETGAGSAGGVFCAGGDGLEEEQAATARSRQERQDRRDRPDRREGCQEDSPILPIPPILPLPPFPPAPIT